MILFIPNPRKGQTGIKRRDSNCQRPLRGGEPTADRHHEKTAGNRDVLCQDCIGSYVDSYFCQNSSNCTLKKLVSFVVCKLQWKWQKCVPIIQYKLITPYTNFPFIMYIGFLHGLLLLIFWAESLYTTSNHYIQPVARDPFKILLFPYSKPYNVLSHLRIKSEVLLSKIYRDLHDPGSPPLLLLCTPQPQGAL